MAPIDGLACKITGLHLGVVRYDKGREPVRFGSTVFNFAAIVATVHSAGGAEGIGVVWTQIKDEESYLRSVGSCLAGSIGGEDARTPFISATACHAEGRRI